MIPIYSRVICFLASDRSVDIADVLSHKLAPIPTALFTESEELRTAAVKFVFKSNTAQLLSAGKALEM